MAIRIGMLVFPKITQLDLTGPFEWFTRIPDAEVSLHWKTTELVTSGSGLSLKPTLALADAPQLDVLVVPGGFGVVPLLDDAEVLAFLRRQAEGARYVTAVCTGSLLLGAAGLLRGYEATTHWAYHDLLAAVGAIPVKKRIVIDRNRITGGGVTAGIDFGLRVAAELCGEDKARAIQLGLEYDPAPPFDSGTPESAGPELTARVRAHFEPSHKEYALRLAR